MPKMESDGIVCHKIFFYDMWNASVSGVLTEYYFEGNSFLYDPKLTFEVQTQYRGMSLKQDGEVSDSYWLPAECVVIKMYNIGDEETWPGGITLTQVDADERYVKADECGVA